MSSTTRNAARNPRDYYSTPEYAFDLMLPILPRGVSIWEPACGDGRLVHWMSAVGISARGADLEPQSPEFPAVDFFADFTRRAFVLTNPPFSLAVEFADHGLKISPEVMLLLPVNFVGSQKRHYWFRKFGISAQFFLSDRPDYTGEGGDSDEYAWYYWGHRWSGHHWPAPVTPFKNRATAHAPFLLWPPPSSVPSVPSVPLVLS